MPPAVCLFWEGGPPTLFDSPPRREAALIPFDPSRKALPWRTRLRNSTVDDKIVDPALSNRPYLLKDNGYEFVTAVHERTLRGWLWTTYFRPTPDEWKFLQSLPGRVALEVTGIRQARAVRSRPFRFSTVERDVESCSIEQARQCEMLE
jgi:hypothetical protein